jgi:predicted DNA-binding transcriptional regulator YafY
VHLRRLEFHASQEYLVAFCHLRGNERHFRLDRIASYEL